MIFRSLLLLTLILCLPGFAQAELPTATPEEVGMSGPIAPQIDEAIEKALAEKKMPGCVVTVVRNGKIVYEKAHGNRRIVPDVEPMTLDTVFDMASLTKPIATGTSIMQLVEQGKIDLDAPVCKYLPEFTGNGKEEVTVREMMIHVSGLIPDTHVREYKNGWGPAYEDICDLKLLSPPGDKFRYSDVNFQLLGEMVTRVSGTPLEDYAKKNVFEPLGMHESGYNPPAELKVRAVTTQKEDGVWLKGTVHDPRARLCGGVAGHAGLFSTSHDLVRYGLGMLAAQEAGEGHILKPETLEKFTAAYDAAGNKRGLGWDKRSGYSSNRGKTMTPKAYGHGGFTGTAMWIDPGLDLIVIFLSNRVHPDGNGSVNRLAGHIGTIAASACLSADELTEATGTKLGIDVLANDKFAALKGKKVGLIANHTSRSKDGKATHIMLHEAKDIDLVTIFSPEHGFAGKLDQSHIGDMVDTETGITVKSLYGETRKPTKEMLADIDVLVFDIQDIGCRFYTYISTMGLAMQAAAENDIEFVLLDRPNPLGGAMEGPMLDEEKHSFVAFHNIPVRHGMTIGELAKMMNAECGWGTNLTVIELENWEHDQLLYETGLPWRNTSPNMRNLAQALLYPGVGLLEMTNVSVGRGTDTPFEILGASWIDGPKLAAAINAYNVPGVKAIGVEFTPTSSKYEGELCGGVNFIITDWEKFETIPLGWAVAASLRELYPEKWETKRLSTLIGNKSIEQMIVDGKSPKEIAATYQEALKEFAKRREPFLLYK